MKTSYSKTLDKVKKDERTPMSKEISERRKESRKYIRSSRQEAYHLK